MSVAKALPNRRLRQSPENRPPGLVRSDLLSEFPLKKLGWLEIFEPARCGYSGLTSAGNNRDNDDDCDNNDARRTSSTAGNRTDNKGYSSTGKDSSNRKGNIRNCPDRTLY
jgi:hypothetical protein